MLRILALETSDLTGGVAAAVDDKLLAEIDLEPRQRSAQSLAPAIRAILAKIGWQPRDVQLLAVTAGPGSFTGLRVGIATAKVFAYATGAAVLGVSTLETIAAAAPPTIDKLSVALDAQRGDVIAQDFQRPAVGRIANLPDRLATCLTSRDVALLTSNNQDVTTGTPAPTHASVADFVPLGPPRLLPLADWLASLPPGFAVSGPVLKKWSAPFPRGIDVLPAELWRPRAAWVVHLAFRDYTAGRRDDVWKLLPIYSRPSAAEEKAAKHPNIKH